MSIHMSVYMSVYMSVHMSVHVSVHYVNAKTQVCARMPVHDVCTHALETGLHTHLRVNKPVHRLSRSSCHDLKKYRKN